MREFTIEAAAGVDRVAIRWSEGDYDYHFIAKVEGDEITDVAVGGLSRKSPTIYRALRAGGRGAISYENANGPEFAPIVEEARRWIGSGKLATQAIAAKRAEVAEREALTVTRKAALLRETFSGFALAALTEMRPESDRALAEAYDRIQGALL